MASKREINARVTEEEFNKLEQEARKTGRTKTDIIREFIRTLPTVNTQMHRH